jgi:hypothetical protein
MSGQVAQWGAAATLNQFTLEALPVVSGTAPGSWIPGQYWIDSASSYAVMAYDGTSPYNTSHWFAVGDLYLALLTTDPATSGSGGGPSVLLSDLVEDTTSGYARQTVTFSQITQSSATVPPAQASNTGTITFGPYTANQALPVQWAALVTASSGTVGLLLYTWNLDTVEQVQDSQPIIIPAGGLVLDQQ